MIRWRRGNLEVTVLSAHGGVSIAVHLRQSDRFLLVDAGDGTSRDLASRRVPAETLEGVVVTHDHGDHSDGLLGPFAVTPFPARHRRSQSDPPGLLMEAYGLRIETAGARVVASGDTGSSARLEREAAGADLALLEAGAGERAEPLSDIHLSRAEAERIGRLAREFRLYHLPSGDVPGPGRAGAPTHRPDP